jgi:hypothetical protein
MLFDTVIRKSRDAHDMHIRPCLNRTSWSDLCGIRDIGIEHPSIPLRYVPLVVLRSILTR